MRAFRLTASVLAGMLFWACSDDDGSQQGGSGIVGGEATGGSVASGGRAAAGGGASGDAADGAGGMTGSAGSGEGGSISTGGGAGEPAVAGAPGEGGTAGSAQSGAGGTTGGKGGKGGETSAGGSSAGGNSIGGTSAGGSSAGGSSSGGTGGTGSDPCRGQPDGDHCGADLIPNSDPRARYFCLKGASVGLMYCSVGCLSGSCTDPGGGSGQRKVACEVCLSTNCSTQLDACNKNWECAYLLMCALGCAGSKPCINECRRLFGAGSALYDPVAACQQQYCDLACR
jgi:hypothetical protein